MNKEWKYIESLHNFKFDDKYIKLIDGTILTEEQANKINELYEKYKRQDIGNVIKEIYILYEIYKYSPEDISKALKGKRHRRGILKLLCGNGIKRERKESAKLANNKRNYGEILRKANISRLKNGSTLIGSKPENYMRLLLNNVLPNYIKNCEIIVGCNNNSLLENGLEVDIPIIIIKNEKTYKFSVEYNGYFYHLKDENKIRDFNKNIMLKDKGYNTFVFLEPNGLGETKLKEHIENYIDTIIIPQIKKILNQGEYN